MTTHSQIQDINGNIKANNTLEGYTTTATAASTTTLTVASAYQQYFTGTTTQTVVMPVTSTLVLGQSWLIVNNSTGSVTIQSSGTNTITTLAASTAVIVTCISTSGTTAASWSATSFSAGGSGTVNSGTSGQVAYYATTGTAVSGEALSALIDSSIGNTQGDILYRDSSAWQVLAPGTSGQFLQTQGSAANPLWATGATGNYQLIATATASGSSTITFTGLTNAYSAYKIVIFNLTAGTNASSLLMRCSTNNGSTYDSTSGHYEWVNTNTQLVSPWANSGAASNSDTSIQLISSSNVSSTAGQSVNLELTFFAPVGGANVSEVFYWDGTYFVPGVNWFNITGSGVYTQASANALQFLMSSGTIATGNFYLYGLTTSASIAGSGLINSGTAGQLAYYSSSGTVLSGGQIGNIKGTATNDNAAAGNVGEFVSSNIPFASAVSLTNATPINVTSISLTAGDWDLSANIFVNPSNTITDTLGWISTTSATIPDSSLRSEIPLSLVGVGMGFVVPDIRLSLATTTIVYLTAYANFASGTATACGNINARRVR